MNELLVLGIVGAVMIPFYSLVYPRAKNISQLQWGDTVATVLSLAIVGFIYFNSDIKFSLVFFETNWFWFTLVLFVALELPAWAIYLKRNPNQGTMRDLYNPVFRVRSEK
jgi:hypothetical protein